LGISPVFAGKNAQEKSHIINRAGERTDEVNRVIEMRHAERGNEAVGRFHAHDAAVRCGNTGAATLVSPERKVDSAGPYG
jgi:hypothetical protein